MALAYTWYTTRNLLSLAKDQTNIARDQAETARRQADLQRETLQSSMSPNVWFDIWVDEQQAAMLVFRLGNNGASVARNVVVTIDPPLSPVDRAGRNPRDVQGSLENGIAYLPPGRVMEWSLGVVFDVVANDPVRERRISIRGKGPFGDFALPEAVIRIDDLRYARAVPPGTLHGVTQAIEGVAKAIGNHHRTMRDS